MNSRARLAGIAALLLLVSTAVSHAQQADSSAAAAHAGSALRSGCRPGRGAIGVQSGTSLIVTGDDYKDGAQPRLTVEASYRYVATRHWRWQVSPYFTWNAYRTGTSVPFADLRNPTDEKDHYLTQIVGGNAQLQRYGGKGNWNWHLGAGPALYRVVLQNRRYVLADPETFRKHQGTYLGYTAEYGVERFLRTLSNTSLEWTLAYHAAFATRDDQFPKGFNSNPGAVELRFGANYYFDFKPEKKPTTLPAHRK